MTLIPTFKKNLFSSDSAFMFIPNKVVKFFKHLESREITLRNPCGCIWDVTVEICGSNEDKAKFVGAWKYFWLVNEIQDGFEIWFTHKKDNLFDVIILDREGVATTQYCGGKYITDDEFEKPRFEAQITKMSFLLGRIAIPEDFWVDVIVSSLKKCNTNATLIGPGGEHWIVDVAESPIYAIHFFRGCDEMIKALELPINGFAIFELQLAPYQVFKVWKKQVP